jgi:hypothetical protein
MFSDALYREEGRGNNVGAFAMKTGALGPAEIAFFLARKVGD